MKLTGQDVVDEIKAHKEAIESDNTLSPKTRNRQAVALEALLYKINVKEKHHVTSTER